MTDSAAPPERPGKLDPETLVLRGRPRPVVRFKRHLLIGLSALGALMVFGVAWLGLRPVGLGQRTDGRELYNTERKPMPDGLATLPVSYGQAAKPLLGPPLPGDLGPPVLERERQLGLAPPGSGSTSLRPTAEDDARRAERMRLASQATQAKEAGIFFQIARRQEVARDGGSSADQERGDLGRSLDAPGPRLSLDLERDQNGQQRKLDFLARPGSRDIYNPHSLQTPLSPYQVMAGAIIAASLVTGLNSDLPGLVVGQVTENVYDTVTGQILLIPQGTRLIGSYDSVVAFGQRRALLVWQRLVMPDGSSIQIDNLPATDSAGYAGLEDEVDFHTWQLLKGIVLSTLLGVGSEISFGSERSDLVRAIRQSTQQNVNQAGQRITEKNLNIQPTITVRPGWPLRIVVHKDLILKPYRL